MRIAIIGQQDFGKATLEAFLARGDTVGAVFCAPEKGRPDPLRVAAEEHGVTVHQFPKLTDPAALEAMRAANVEVGVMAYVTQFVPQDFCNIPTFGTIQFHPSLLPLHRGASSMSWSIGSVLSHKWQMKVDPFTATGWQMLFAAIGNAIVALVSGEYRHVVVTHRAMMAVLYLVVFGSWVGYTAYIWLLKHVPTPKVATYAYVNPVVAVFLGWLLHSEKLDGPMLGGMVIIVVGVALVTTAKVHDAGKEVAEGTMPELEAEV